MDTTVNNTTVLTMNPLGESLRKMDGYEVTRSPQTNVDIPNFKEGIFTYKGNRQTPWKTEQTHSYSHPKVTRKSAERRASQMSCIINRRLLAMMTDYARTQEQPVAKHIHAFYLSMSLWNLTIAKDRHYILPSHHALVDCHSLRRGTSCNLRPPCRSTWAASSTAPSYTRVVTLRWQ